MKLEELQNIANNPALPGGFDNSALFDQLGQGLQPLTEFDTIEPREALYHNASNAVSSLFSNVPDEYRNYQDPTGLAETRFNESSDTTVAETRVFGRLIRSTETDTYSREESLTLGKETPLETVFSHTVSEREVTTTFPTTPAIISSTSAFSETYGIENSLLSAGLSHNDNSTSVAGNPLLETHSTKLSLGLANEAEVSISFSDLSLTGERVIEAVTVEYPGLEGEQSTLPLPVSTNLLVPLALGTAEGFANNPDPSALLDTLTELAALPEPIGSVTGGGLPEGFTSLPALA